MKIQIDPHTLDRARERGSDEQEIIDASRYVSLEKLLPRYLDYEILKYANMWGAPTLPQTAISTNIIQVY